jgi:hypothetical protein
MTHDPADFKKQSKIRSKLREREDLIDSLLRDGWSAYLIWRYLNEKCDEKVSRTTVYECCVRRRAAGAVRTTSTRDEPGRGDVSPTTPGSSAVGGSPPASEANATAVPEDLRGTKGEAATMSTTRGLGSDPMVVHVQVPQSPANANAVPYPPTFAPSIERPAPKIDVAPGVQPFTPGNVIRTYSSSTPEARRKIRAFLEAEWGRDVDRSTGGPQSDEHDDFERR